MNEEKKRLICTRHCKYTQIWCLGQLCNNEARVFPSNQGDISTCVNELTGYHDCNRCIALLDKHYGHRCYRIDFAHEELQHQNDDVRSGSHFDLVNTFTREETEVEFILDCLFTESQIQRTPDALNIMANSVLKFIWKIGEQSVYYTTVCYQQKLKVYGSLRSKESSFNDFIWAFLNRDYRETMCVQCVVLPRPARRAR